MSSLTFLIYALFLLFPSFQPAISVDHCEEINGSDCSTCFLLLVSEAIEGNENQFNIQNTFFPPEKSSPSFVTVHYRFSDSNNTQVWFWSAAFFYMLHPLHVFQFTSLFFSDINLHSSEVFLTLPLNCSEARNDYFRLLTQRVSNSL